MLARRVLWPSSRLRAVAVPVLMRAVQSDTFAGHSGWAHMRARQRPALAWGVAPAKFCAGRACSHARMRACASAAPRAASETDVEEAAEAAGRAAHSPVLLEAVVGALGAAPRPLVLDGTVGAGGHAAALLRATRVGHYVALDRDPAALALARERLAPIAAARGSKLSLLHADFRRPAEALARAGVPPGTHIDAALLDVGVSSMQLDDPRRGFSFLRDGPLDMRMDAGAAAGVLADDVGTGTPGQQSLPAASPSAADLVNSLGAEELTWIFREYGEEPRARLMADRVVRARPFATTLELAEALAGGRRRSARGVHPATLCFQALRIAVNDELGALGRALPELARLLTPGSGRLGVISFHSLEDRIAKRTFRDLAAETGGVRILTKRPVVADDDECRRNPRSRSAKLRVVQRLGAHEAPRIGKVNKYRPDG